VPHVVAPHRQRRAMTWCSVIRTRIGRQIKHLPPLQTYLRRIRQTRTAATAVARLMPHPVIRVNNLRQRRPRMPGLSTRLASTRTPQGLRRRLAKRRIRRRRLRGIPRVLPQPRTQLSDLRLKLSDPRSLHRHQSSKLVIGRTRINRHHTMINTPDAKINEPRRGPDAMKERGLRSP
jgi:hypothetical protein